MQSMEDWSHMYNQYEPWLVGSMSRRDFEKFRVNDRISMLQTCIGKTLINFGYDNKIMDQYYLTIVTDIATRPSVPGGPKPDQGC